MPVMVAVVVFVTAFVVTPKVARVAPAGMVTDAGTVAFAEFDERLTANPPEGAAPLRLTVPVPDAPPPTGFGIMDTLDSVAG